MYKTIARVMFVTMLWSSLAWAQSPPPEPETTTKESGARYVDDPYYMDYRSGRRIMVGLDQPIDPDTYVVGPSDQFLLSVRGARDMKVQLRVLPEGTIQLPNVGVLDVAGLTITAMRSLIRERLRSYYRNVEIDFQLIVPRTLLVYVLGEVAEPGAVELYAPFRLDRALHGAGGVTERGSLRSIEIRRGGELSRTADFLSFLRLGDLGENPDLQEGMTVYVPARGPACTVMGEVWRGGNFEVLGGETVADMIDLAGGFTPNALSDRLVLERLDPQERLSVFEFANAEAGARSVQGRDVVVVPDRNSFPGTDFVRINGGGGRDGIVHIQPGETIASFLPRFTRLQRTHDLSRAVVERQLPSGEVRYIPVDLEAVIDGSDDGSLVLLPGDVINVPQYELSVFVLGEVTAPGPIPFQRGLPAERYIALAGGPRSNGSIDRLDIISMDGEKRGGDRSSVVYRGETILVKQKKSRVFQTVFVSATALTSLILSTIALSR